MKTNIENRSRANVREYREAIDAVYYWIRSFKSAADNSERVKELFHVKHALECLALIDCATAKPYDLERAEHASVKATELLSRLVFEYESFEDVVEFAESIGFDWSENKIEVERLGESDPRLPLTIAGIESDAIQFIRENGYEVTNYG